MNPSQEWGLVPGEFEVLVDFFLLFGLTVLFVSTLYLY
jgi:hypothetical protein